MRKLCGRVAEHAISAMETLCRQTEIQEIEVATILNPRNTFLFRNSQPWVKKNKENLAEDNFDVSAGDGELTS